MDVVENWRRKWASRSNKDIYALNRYRFESSISVASHKVHFFQKCSIIWEIFALLSLHLTNLDEVKIRGLQDHKSKTIKLKLVNERLMIQEIFIASPLKNAMLNFIICKYENKGLRLSDNLFYLAALIMFIDFIYYDLETCLVRLSIAKM